MPYSSPQTQRVLFVRAKPITALWVICAVLTVAAPASSQAQKKSVAGKADVLRHVPKKFATLQGIDVDKRQVKLTIEGEAEATTWDIATDAELKVHGWWGRLEQFKPGDRVWAWFAIDRKKKPQGILMLADEVSQQDIHGAPPTLKAFDADSGMATLQSKTSGERKLEAADSNPSKLIGEEVYVQTAGNAIRTLLSKTQFEELREQQRQTLRDIWRTRGLPATVTFLHPLSGEMEVTLDHEGMRWGRYLKSGDSVTLAIDSPVKATAKHVEPWRERTRVRLVTNSGVDQFDLSVGQRIQVQVPAPPAEVQQADFPSDIGRRKSKQDRVEWFLTSTYCSCKIAGDRCTGMFYSLASCNENACGMPRMIREKVGELIDDGMTDEEVWRKLLELRGPSVSKPHLLR